LTPPGGFVSDQVKRVLYVQTTGVEAPEKSATAMFLASAAAAMEVEAAIYFTQFGPTLLKKGAGEAVRVKKGTVGATVKHFIDQAMELGVRFYVCQPSLDLNDMTKDDLIRGVEIIGGAAFNDLALEADQVISF
jgi:predicted peroxiredoxin